MSPRNERYQVPGYIAQGIRDKRKKLLHGPYSCPKCSLDKLRIEIDVKEKKVVAFCGSCGLEQELAFVPVFEGVDYYAKCVDKFKKPIP